MVKDSNLKDTFNIEVPTRLQLKEIINSMKPTPSTGTDGLNMKLFKDYYSVLEEPIFNLIKTTILTGKFPETLKVAKVIPILKANNLDPTNPANYRPINLLCALSKILEKTIFVQLQTHLDKHNIIPSNHYGGRKHHTTSTALIDLYESQIVAYEKGHTSAIISVDQSAAFDLIDHKILLDRLKILGATPHSLLLLSNYLSDRSQLVELDCKKSVTLSNEKCSVIQGSLGSCLLYTIGTLDLPASLHINHPHPITQDTNCPDGRITTYVDDCNGSVSSNNLIDLESKAQKIMDTTVKFLNNNRLMPNPNKNQLLVTKTQGKDTTTLKITTQGQTLTPTPHLKTLGIHLSNTLDWTKQIKILTSQIQPQISAMRQLAKFSSRNTLQKVAKAMIFGKITYGIQLWGGTTLANKKRIQTLINTVAKIILGGRSYRMSTPKMMQELEWMSIDQLVDTYTLNTATTTLHTQLPVNLYNKLNILPRKTRSGNRVLPSWKKLKSTWSFTNRALVLINQSSPNIISCPDPKLRKAATKKQVTLSTSHYTTMTGSKRKTVFSTNQLLTDVILTDGGWRLRERESRIRVLRD